MNKLILQALAYSDNGGGGTDVSDTTATAADVLSGKYFHIADGTKTQGTIPSKSGSDLVIEFNGVTVPSGYYPRGAYTEIGTPVAGGIKTPTTSRTKIYDEGDILASDAYIEGDANLVAGNIKNGTTIFGVTGSYAGSGTDVSDTTAVAGDVLAGKYFHIADGTKVEGSIVSKSSTDVTNSDNVVSIPAGYYGSAVSHTVGTAQAAQTITPTTTNQTIAAGKYLTGAQTISGDANLVAGNIKDGVSIFGVTGNYSGGGGMQTYTFPYFDDTYRDISAQGKWLPFMGQYGSYLDFSNFIDRSYQLINMFSFESTHSNYTDAPIDLSIIKIPVHNTNSTSYKITMEGFMQYNNMVGAAPKLMRVDINGNEITTAVPGDVSFGRMNYMFYGANNLRTIDNAFFQKVLPDVATSGTEGTAACQYMFHQCYSLRNHPNLNWISAWNGTGANTNPYTYMFNLCYNLDSITIPIICANNITSNLFNTTFVSTCCASSVKFTNPANYGTKTWSNQTIALSGQVGYGLQDNRIYNSGRTAGVKLINDLASWTQYHNDVDSYAVYEEWSKYNHDSAVETINSLPDVSNGTDNTITFRGNAGSGYGKAISDLTAAEIAVATAKGWTVTIY